MAQGPAAHRAREEACGAAAYGPGNCLDDTWRDDPRVTAKPTMAGFSPSSYCSVIASIEGK